MNIGDLVYTRYIDIDDYGCGDIICEGIVTRELMNGTIMVCYKDDNYFDVEREFFPHDLKLIERA